MAGGSHSGQYSIMPLMFSHSLSSAMLSLSPLSMSLSLTVATYFFFLKNFGSLAWLKWKTEVILQVKPQGTDLVCNINSSSRTSRGCWLELFETFAGSVVIHSEGFYHVQHFFFFFFGYCSWNPQKSEAFRALASLWFLKWFEGKEMLQMILNLNNVDIYSHIFSYSFQHYPSNYLTHFTYQSYEICIFLFFRLYLLKHIFNLLLQFLNHVQNLICPIF